MPPRAALLLGLLLLVPTPAPAGRAAQAPQAPEPIERLGERARLEKKALVVNVGASWCGPCKLLDEHVLTQAEVKKALSAVLYVHYDAEVGAGVAAAKALGVHGFPTLVARAQDGSEISRIQGVPSAGELARWLQRVAAESEPLDVLLARVQRDPKDSRALLTLARRYRKRGEADRARKTLEQTLAAATSRDEGIAAHADWGLRMDHIQMLLRKEPQRALAEHLARFPAGPMADSALKSLARLGPADDKVKLALAGYIDAHLGPGQEDALNQAVYSCLRAAAFDEAERAARHLLKQAPGSVLYLDTLAEVLHLRGDQKGALLQSDQALKLLQRAPRDEEGDQLRAQLQRNQARFRRGKGEPPPQFAEDEDDPFPWDQY